MGVLNKDIRIYNCFSVNKLKHIEFVHYCVLDDDQIVLYGKLMQKTNQSKG